MEKKKISNSAELNKYYDMINIKLKKFSEMNIPHNKVVSYLKPGSENFKNFISEDDDLKDVEGIEVVLKDIIEDTYHAFKDGLFKKINKTSVKTFESLITENMIDVSSITKKDEHEHEKALADIYKVSMSYINLINSKIHLYSVEDVGEVQKVIVFNKEELTAIKHKMVDYLTSEVSKRATNLAFKKTVNLIDIMDMNVASNVIWEKIPFEDVIKFITYNTGLNVEVNYMKSVEKNSTEYYLFNVSKA